MATENVGGIQYTVDADTAAMLKAEAVVNKSISKQVKDFDKADTAVRTFIATQEKLGRTVNSMGQVMNANGKIVANATTQYRTLATNAQSGFSTLNTQINGTAKAVRGARPDMQNMSYQLQDMAVQAQMGTSAFVIMAQQLPQMLVGMGAWAGAIGVAITVLGLMATTMIDTTSDMEKLEKAVEQVKAVITVGAHGVAEYSAEMKKLSTISKEIVKIELNTAMAQQAIAIRSVGEAAQDAYKKAIPLFNFSFDNSRQSDLIKSLISDEDIKRLGSGSSEITKAKTGIVQLIAAMEKIKAGKTSEGVEDLTGALELLSGSAVQNTKRGSELVGTMSKIVKEYKLGKIRVDSLKEALKDTSVVLEESSGKTDKSADMLQEYLKNIELSTLAMKGNERELEKRRLELTDMTEQEQITALAAWDYMKKVESQTEAVEAAIEADKKRKKSLEDVSDSLDAYFDKESADDKKKAERETTSNINFAQNIIESGETPEQRMAEQYARLNELRQTDLENAELYQDAMTSLEQQAAQNREDLLGESYKRIGQQAADSMGDYLAGVETAEDATRMLASTILSEVIQSLVQMGMSAVTQSLTTTTAATTGIAATTGAAVTSTGVMAGAQSTAMATVAGAVGGVAGGLATAWAPAAAFASLATLGTNSGPAIAGIYATMAATLGAQLVGGLASNAIEAGTGFAGANMSGAREFGGPVTAGKSYLVGERGPEMFTPGSSGGITSNKDMASGGQMNVIINNNAAGVDVSANQIDQRTVEISVRKSMQEFANQASTGQGVAINALTRNTNVTRKGGV